MMTDEFSAIVNNPTAIVPLWSQQRMIPNNGRSRDIATSLLPKVYLLLRENSDTFVNIEQAQYKKLDNYWFNQRCEFEGSAYHMLSSYDAIRFFFEQKNLIHTRQNGQAKLIEILPLVKKVAKVGEIIPGDNVSPELIPRECFPLPGDNFLLSNICSKAGLVHTSRSNPIFSAGQGYPNILILSRLYKNDWAMCIAYSKLIKE